jgi:hypothetical protein
MTFPAEEVRREIVYFETSRARDGGPSLVDGFDFDISAALASPGIT